MNAAPRTVVCNNCQRPLDRDKAVRDVAGELVHFECLPRNQQAAEDIARRLRGVTVIADVESDTIIDLQEVR
ncbi:MAG: hypothetical protein ACOCY1_06095 [Halovenus sp.]